MTSLKRHALALASLSLLLILSACTQRLPLPAQTPQLALPIQLHIQRRSQDEAQDWLLVIQQEGTTLRWSLLTPIGIPLARQLLVDGHWQADGLLPTNAEARELFAALLFALSPADQLPELYAGMPWAQRQAERSLIGDAWAWRVRYLENDRFDLDVGSTLTYGVAPLSTTGAPPR